MDGFCGSCAVGIRLSPSCMDWLQCVEVVKLESYPAAL